MLASFWEVGTQVTVLFLLIALGFFLSKIHILREGGVSVMTDVVLYAVTPCVIVNAFQRDYEPRMLKGLLLSLLIAFLALLFSALLAELLFRKRNVERAVVLKFAVVFSNCGFMALPLQEAVLGRDGVFYGAAFVAVFNLFMWTWGVITMSGKTDRRASLKAIANPGVIGTVIGVLLFAFSVKLPTVIASPVSMLASLNTPVPMLIIGFHLSRTKLASVLKDRDAYLAMALRLIVIPLLTLWILRLLKIDQTVLSAMVIAVASPVAAFTTMMSAKFGRDVELSAGIVSLSALLSLVTMPLVVGWAVSLG